MKTFITVILVGLLMVGTTLFGVFGGWFDTWFTNKVDYIDQKIDDRTNYATMKKVEDTCRAMIASYNTDKQTYLQYKDSDNEEKQGWGEQAKMRANKTANTYNEYILKNSFVWEGNIPSDISRTLYIVE